MMKKRIGLLLRKYKKNQLFKKLNQLQLAKVWPAVLLLMGLACIKRPVQADTGRGALFGGLTGATVGGLAGGRRGAGIGLGVGLLGGALAGSARNRSSESPVERSLNNLYKRQDSLMKKRNRYQSRLAKAKQRGNQRRIKQAQMKLQQTDDALKLVQGQINELTGR